METDVSNAVLINKVTLREIERTIERIVKKNLSDLECRLMERKDKQPPKPIVVAPKKSGPIFIKRLEAAKLLGVNVSTIDVWSKCGILHGHKMGRKVYFSQDEIERRLGNHPNY